MKNSRMTNEKDVDRTRTETREKVVGDRGEFGGVEISSRCVKIQEVANNCQCAPILLRPEEIHNLVPEFCPEKVTVDKWLRKIENLKRVYNWEDRAVLHYATVRLGSAPKIWYEGVEENINGWIEFKQQISRAFPSRIDEVDAHSYLARRLKTPGESYEHFIHSIVSKARMADLSEAATIKYIINGIPDSSLQMVLSTAGHDTVEKLMKAIYRFESQSNMRRMSNSSSSFSQDQVRRNSGNCFNCGQHDEFRFKEWSLAV